MEKQIYEKLATDEDLEQMLNGVEEIDDKVLCPICEDTRILQYVENVISTSTEYSGLLLFVSFIVSIQKMTKMKMYRSTLYITQNLGFYHLHSVPRNIDIFTKKTELLLRHNRKLLFNLYNFAE